MKEKIICFAICFILAFEPLPAYAIDPVSTTLTVVGGTMGTEGLAAIGATGPVALAAVGVTVAVMAGLHLDSKISQASANAGMTKSAYVKQKISEYCSAKGKTIGDFSKAILETVKVSREGLIYMGKDAVNAFTDLFDWLDLGGQMVDVNSISGVTSWFTGYRTSTFVLDGKNLFYGNYNGRTAPSTYTESVAMNYVAAHNNNANYPYTLIPFVALGVIGTQTWSCARYREDNFSRDGNGAVVQYSSERYKFGYQTVKVVPSGIPVYDDIVPASKSEIADFLDGIEETSVDDRDAITYENPWEQVKAEIQPEDGESVVVDPHAIGAIADSYPAVGDLTISLGDYLDALRKAWDGTIADTIPAVDALTGEEVAIPIPQDLVDSIPADTTVDIVGEDTIDDTNTTPAIDDTVPPSPADALQGMSVGLDDIFPFCIPFDIYHILQKFNATPETPVVDLQFNSSIIGVAIPLHIDLHDYDGVAQVARTMELVAYVVGLAIITRKTILRG